MGFVDDAELGLKVECLVCEGFGAMKKPPEGMIREIIYDDNTNAPPRPHFDLIREPELEKTE
jgi:hypothetical protein